MSDVNTIAKDIVTADLTEDDINRLWSLLKEKTRELRVKATMLAKFSLTVGVEVFTSDLRPKALNGLTGKIIKITKTRADIELDKEPDSWSPIRKYVRGRTLASVPLSCLKENKLRNRP